MPRRFASALLLLLLLGVEFLLVFELIDPFKFESRQLPTLWHRWQAQPTPESEAAWKRERDRVIRINASLDIAIVGLMIGDGVGIWCLVRRLRTSPA